MGLALPSFTDFFTNTGPAFLTGVNEVINEAQKQTYVLGKLLKGRGMDEVVQGGRTIDDTIMFESGGTYAHYDPNDTFQWRNPQLTTQISVPWRFSIAHMSWTDQEVELQVSDGMSAKGAGQVYKRIKRIKEQSMWTDMLNGMENDLWRAAQNAQDNMEGNVANVTHMPYSFGAFITENTTDYHETGWSTIETVDPATQSGWRNRVRTYDYDDPFDADGDRDGLIHAFDNMFLDVQFESPGTKEEYFTKVNLNRQMICASFAGVNMYKDFLRQSNDRLVSPQDGAYNDPAYSGIPVKGISTLNTAAIYGSTPAVELSATPDGYRYWWINGNFVKPVFHSRRYMEVHDPMRHPNQPFTTIVPTDTWWNLLCRKRTACGIVAPQA